MKNREISKATINAVATGLLGQFVTIFSGIIVARSLGAEGRGYLALLFLFPILITSVGALGLPNAITYFVARGNISEKIFNVVFRKIIPLQIIILIIVHGIVLFFYLDSHDNIYLSAISTLLITPMLLLQQYCMSFIQGANKFSLFNVLRLLVPVLYTLMLLVIWLFDIAHLFTVVCMWIAANLLAVIVICNEFAKIIHDIEFSNNENVLTKDIVVFGAKGMFGAVTPLESFRLDHVLAAFFLTPAILGVYVVGQAFSNVPNFISRSASMIAFPIISNKTKSTGLSLIWKFFGVITIFNLIVSLVLVLVLPYILPFLFGSEFNAVILGQILIIGTTLSASRRILVEGLRGVGLPHIWGSFFIFAAQWAASNLQLENLLGYISLMLAPLILSALYVGLIDFEKSRSIPFGLHPNWWEEVAFGFVLCSLVLKRFLLKAFFIGIGIGLMISVQSRGALLAVLVLFLAYFIMQFRPLGEASIKRLLILSVVFLVCLIISFVTGLLSEFLNIIESKVLLLNDPYRGIDSRMTGRLDGWMHAIMIFKDNPVFGQGIDTLLEVHNGFLRWAGEGGVLLLGVMMLLILSSMAWSWHRLHEWNFAVLMGIMAYLMTYPRALNMNLVSMVFFIALFSWKGVRVRSHLWVQVVSATQQVKEKSELK